MQSGILFFVVVASRNYDTTQTTAIIERSPAVTFQQRKHSIISCFLRFLLGYQHSTEIHLRLDASRRRNIFCHAG